MILTALIADASLFIAGTLLGALLLLVGLAIGVWAGRRTAPHPHSDQEHTVRMVGGLYQWANDVVGDVAQHRETMSKLAEQVNSVEPSGNETHAVTLLAEIVQANEQLQKRLDNAEATLKNQSDDVSAYLAEARTDSLTGLANRRAFDNELENRISQPLSVVMIDVDHFKSLNDRFGHLAGDQILVEIAQTLQRTFGDDGLVARFGGDEFAVVLPAVECADAGQLTELARQSIESLELTDDGNQLRASVSCGVAGSLPADEIDDLLRRSDEALYQAKHRGRNRVCVNDGSSHGAVSKDPMSGEITPKLSAACNDLRRRLLEVTDA